MSFSKRVLLNDLNYLQSEVSKSQIIPRISYNYEYGKVVQSKRETKFIPYSSPQKTQVPKLDL